MARRRAPVSFRAMGRITIPILSADTYAISVPHFWQNLSPGWTGEMQLGQDLAVMLSSATGAALLARLASGIAGCGCGAGAGVRTRAS